MSKELVISSNRHETKVALIEDDQLVEVYFQRSNEYSLAGSIHKGRVTRVLPGMQSAFVDLGLERDTFLYVSDFLEEHEDFDKITGNERAPRERERGRDRDRDRDRGDRERREAALQAKPAAEADGAAPVEAGEGAPKAAAVEGGVAAAAPAGGASRQGDRERRGRRSRRRRGGQGFPESKYASDADHAAKPEEARDEPAAEAEPQAALPVEPLILPGETLAKYRHGAPPEPAATESAAERIAEEPNDDAEDIEFDEPSHYPPENAVPDAPLHAGMPESEPALPVAEPEVAAAFMEDPATEEPGVEEEDAEDREPAVASLLDDDEDRDIQAMILGEVEGIEIAQSEEESGDESGAAGGPGEGAAESGTASVRERGGRYPHRVARRRRRGRGGQPGGAPATPEPGEAPAEAEPPRGERQERTVSRPAGGSRSNQGQPSISDLLKEGQEIIVQIAKEPLGQKGARITSHIALPGRYVVYMPTLEHMGVSRKIASDEERLRLKRVLQAKRPGPVGGFITRTAAEGRTEDEIAGDMLFLYNLWQDIRAKAEKKPSPAMLHHDLDIVQRILRDQLADSFKAIWIDNEEHYESVLRFVERFQPMLIPKVKLYTREAPIFDAFGVTNELEKALRPKVWLKSGGFIVINQTEALVAIDVNTGKYVGKTNRLEDTIVKTNTEAIKEIVRQIRLRDLGGIIVIDFIDMDERKNRQKVMQTLEETMRVDRAPYKILQFNDFGLVAITRKRVKQSLERTLCAPCPHCEGAGYVKSPQTVVSEILTEAGKLSKSIQGKDVVLRVHPDVAKVLKSNQNKFLEELEEMLRRPVLIKSDPQLHHEKFDLA
ncbi:MAG: Rne/Rng family ribonuclease [Bryobacterales bacterium]|nr:Rne/Rng family ribonuclease [Bryobacterales bacterium]